MTSARFAHAKNYAGARTDARGTCTALANNSLKHHPPKTAGVFRARWNESAKPKNIAQPDATTDV